MKEFFKFIQLPLFVLFIFIGGFIFAVGWVRYVMPEDEKALFLKGLHDNIENPLFHDPTPAAPPALDDSLAKSKQELLASIVKLKETLDETIKKASAQKHNTGKLGDSIIYIGGEKFKRIADADGNDHEPTKYYYYSNSSYTKGVAVQRITK